MHYVLVLFFLLVCFCWVFKFFFYCRGLFLLTGDTHRIDMAFANNICAREMLFLLVYFFLLWVMLGKMFLPKRNKLFKFM